SRPTHPGELRAPASIVVASVLLDRAVGLALIASVAALLGIVAGGRDAGPMVAVLIALSLGLAGGLVVLRHAPLHRIGWLSSGRVGRTVMPVLSYLRDPRAPRAIALAAAMSIVVAAVQFGVIRGLVFALGATPAEERWVYVGSAMAFIVAAVPALPGGWGTADATYVFFFGLAGLVPAISLAVCLLYRLFWYLSGVLGAILYVSRNRYQPVTASPVEDSANSP
ncbi:MAG: lysylphosphatidylglycerol synthase domain-containing protein, partial [Polyangiaceae bacterium]